MLGQGPAYYNLGVGWALAQQISMLGQGPTYYCHSMNTNRLFVVFLLGFSSGLPFALLTGTLQAWFADSGMSVMQVGMLS